MTPSTVPSTGWSAAYRNSGWLCRRRFFFRHFAKHVSPDIILKRCRRKHPANRPGQHVVQIRDYRLLALLGSHVCKESLGSRAIEHGLDRGLDVHRRDPQMLHSPSAKYGAMKRVTYSNQIIRPSSPFGLCRARFVFVSVDAPRVAKGEAWCPGAGSNHRHCDFQSHALPTELPGRR